MARSLVVCKRLVLLALMVVVCASCSYAAVGEREERDELCQMLFDEYIAQSGKISGAEMEAAEAIIASRGRTSGFWKPVLEELQKNSQRSERACLDVLGLMLQADASARDSIQSGQLTQALQQVCLPSDIVPELITRAQKAEGNSLEFHLIALVRARDERCKDLFSEIITGVDKREPTESGKFHVYMDSAQFHAAVGLANLGEPAGVEWLIEHCEDLNARVDYAAPPAGVRELGDSCVLALQSLTERRNLNKKADFEEWWKTALRPFAPRHEINLENR